MSSDYDSAHDWFNILSMTNRLNMDTQIASVLKIVGASLCIIGIVLGVSLIATIMIESVKIHVNNT
jgi:hypothetical protein